MARINWDEQPLGQVDDASLARLLEVSRSAVREQRIRRGIPTCPTFANCKHVGINWDEQPLGQVDDYDLARRLKVRRSTVHYHRTRRGIPPLHPPHRPQTAHDC